MFMILVYMLYFCKAHGAKKSVQINHGGYFLGRGSNRSYVNAHVVWYDELHEVTWSPLVVENIVEEIGWEMAGILKVYYLIPILSITQNGLREIRGDADTDQMLTFLSLGHKSFSLYLDHDNSLDSNRYGDDVVNFPITHLPPVFSPRRACNNEPETVEETHVEAEHPIPIQVVYPDSSADDVSNYVFAKRNCSVVNDEDANMEEAKTVDLRQNNHKLKQHNQDLRQNNHKWQKK